MSWRIFSLIPPAGMLAPSAGAPSAAGGLFFARTASTASECSESAEADLALRDMFWKGVPIYGKKTEANVAWRQNGSNRRRKNERLAELAMKFGAFLQE